MAGWIKVYRDIQEHWIWQDANKLKWWLDIILMANHKDNKFLLGNELFEVKRGEWHTSELKLAERWDVNRKTVRKFLDLLENDQMITLHKTQKGTTIKVNKYNAYQGNFGEDMDNPMDNPMDNSGDNGMDNPMDNSGDNGMDNPMDNGGDTNKNEKNNKNDKEGKNEEECKKNEKKEENKKHIVQQVDTVWARYPLKKGKAAAIKKIPKLIEKHGYEQLIRCIERYELGLKKELWRKPQNGSTFFNSGYVDYLDENYQEPVEIIEALQESESSGYMSEEMRRLLEEG